MIFGYNISVWYKLNPNPKNERFAGGQYQSVIGQTQSF